MFFVWDAWRKQSWSEVGVSPALWHFNRLSSTLQSYVPVTSMGLLLHGSDQMLLTGSLPQTGNWQSDQQNLHCPYMQLWPHSKPFMELMALVTFWELMFPWLSLIFINMTANSLAIFFFFFLVDVGEVMEENDSFSCSVWVCEPMDLKPQEYRKIWWEEKLHWRFCQIQKQQM